MKIFGCLRAFAPRALLAACVLAWATAAPGQIRIKLTPELHSGGTLRYDIRGRVQRHVKEQSRAGSISTPGDVKDEFSGTLRVTIRDARVENGRPVVEAQAGFEYPDDGAAKSPVKEQHKLNFTISGNGQLTRLDGLEDLSPIERIAWQFWISRFAFGWTLPAEGWKRGETKKSEEPENNPVPIAHLFWKRETTFGENGKCPAIAAETCIEFYTNASLKQKSSSQDSTPEDYKLHELKTSGTAAGTNEIYTTISQKTGLAMRGTEDLRQTMDVVIAKTDASNAVKYAVDVSSHFEMVFVDVAKR
jgi:hypothetical protein